MSDSKNDLDEISVTSRLLNLVFDMPMERQIELLRLMDEWKHKGARRHPRKNWKVAVEYAADDQVYRDYIKDIGGGGVFIETRVPFVVGQEIKLKFPLPNYKRLIKVAGEIVWSSPEGIGVRFKKEDKPPA